MIHIENLWLFIGSAPIRLSTLITLILVLRTGLKNLTYDLQDLRNYFLIIG